MSVVKEYGKFVPTCDICGETLEPEDEYMDAVGSMRFEGWERRKNADTGEYENYCTVCKEINL